MHFLSIVPIITLWYEYTTGECPKDAIKVEEKIQRGKVLENAAFWTGKMEEITDCAVGCVRRKVCESFNYYMLKKRCDLNSAVDGKKTFRETTNGSVHSYISKWPLSKIDPSCGCRPCTDHQVCLPQLFAPSENCSYICIDLTIYKSKCSGEASCQIINGTCKEGLCECPGGKKYDGAEKKCIVVCEGNLEELYPEAENFTGTVEERNFTCKDGKIKVEPKLECRLDPDTETSKWYPEATICVDVYGSDCSESDDAPCKQINAICTNNMCQCPKNMYFNVAAKVCTKIVESDNKTRCDEIGGDFKDGKCECGNDKYYDQDKRKCRNVTFKLVRGRDRNGFNRGRLLMKNESSWYNVNTDNWNWKMTQHACKAIDPTFVYGGSFHGPDVYGEGYAHETLKIGKPDCDFADVENLHEHCNLQRAIGHYNDIGLTCFTTNITSAIIPDYWYTYQRYSPYLKYRGWWGGFCFKDCNKAIEVACKSIAHLQLSCEGECVNPWYMYRRWNVVKDVNCNGNETSLLFCMNGGFEYHPCNENILLMHLSRTNGNTSNTQQTPYRYWGWSWW